MPFKRKKVLESDSENETVTDKVDWH